MQKHCSSAVTPRIKDFIGSFIINKNNNRTLIGQQQPEGKSSSSSSFTFNQYRRYGQKVDGLLSDIHEKVFSNQHLYTTKIFHVAVDGYNQKKYKEATEFFTKVIEKGKEVIAISKKPPTKEFTIDKQILWSFIYRGVITNSYQDLQKAKEINPFHPEVFYRRGNLFYFDSNYSSAIKDYSKAIANHPDFYECYFNRGLCYYQLKRLDRCIKDLETYLKHVPNDPNTLKLLGISYYYEYVLYDSRRELLVKSVEALTSYINYRKQNSLPLTKEDYLIRGSSLRELKQLDLAQQDFQAGSNSSIKSLLPPIIITPVDCFTQERVALDTL
ncbi:predicted protein [Naegleria gruberi]|uniref:Predicted protein n=1 Tax=Naegleria gruberi TaxID=5762 RepID=D2W100_NAEGR|nr:uncharacterized protein NAEGRDRAFT_75039 [Naegleria gruberi]EFC37270.1 predicted protein [Naegleria gruberi]|eukprot:XP_002670014.1 predicted protein [Naegleria gruberi strain NEG-M]